METLRISLEKKHGLIDKKGDIVIPPEYDYISIGKKNIIAEIDNKYYLFDHNGSKLRDGQFNKLVRTGPCDLFLNVGIDSLVSLRSSFGDEIFKNSLFEQINEVTDSLLIAKSKDSWYYFPLDNSDPIGPFKKANRFIDNKAIVISKKSNKQYIIDKEGNSVSNEYDNIKRAHHHFIVQAGDKFAILNPTLDTTMINYYDKIFHIKNDVFIASKDGKFGLLNAGNILLAFNYDNIENNDHLCGYIKIYKNGKIGFADLKGNILMPPNINHVDYCWLGYLLVETDAGYGILDKDMKYIIQPIYEDLSHFEDGVSCAAKKNNLWGFLNRKGEYFIKAQFEQAFPFRYGSQTTAIKDSVGWRFINFKGEYVNDQIFTSVKLESKRKNHFFVEKDNKLGVIDSNGEIFIPLKFDRIKRSYSNWLIYLNDEYIKVDKSLKCIENCERIEILKQL